MNIKYIQFPDSEYVKEVTKKELIVLHHTVSSSGGNVDDWWMADRGKSRVATSYVVEKDGSVIQVFDPSFWAYHIGKGSTNIHNKRSVGIEIVNEGGLFYQEGSKKYFWLDGKHEFKGQVFANADSWRGYKYYAMYTEAQLITVAELVKKLCQMFGIKKDMLKDFQYKPEYLMHSGICCHHNLRADKTDLSPAFPLSRLQGMI